MRLLTTIEIKLRAFSGMGYEFTDIAGPVLSHHRIYYFVCNIVFFFQSCLRVSDKNVLSVKGYLLNVADVEAAKFQDVLINDLFLDPLYKGSYPEMALDSLAKYNPAFKPGAEDMAFIAAQKPDFLGVNFYAPAMVKGEDTPMSLKWLDNNPDSIKSNVGPVMPEYLYKILMRLKTEYNNPKVYITENGTG
ncbi:MAG: family 1 glycosylhydrolase, partial [Chitinophagaceae bacterium]